MLRWVHAIPNGGKRSVTAAQRAKAEGLTSGVADVFVPVARQGYHGLYLEFKTPTGRLSPNQKQFQNFCNDGGYMYVIVRSVDDAIKVTSEYLSL